ncbi:GIY-YIG nuclease family protein [Pedobacter jejuensis]|uniref:GIY-YIG nuclease family protein n=1 Tax=Pedobacter jejuensis TaxID=1268550 RepID=A0A3N0BT21_9SPHI|nr:GIY-YIG nuclease family protein [Pedobacter jejuensis]RNL52213.1 GIY-YIG nuclease family protein [Pedobacter jejuensis]
MERGGFVYIMTNKNHKVLYTGVTSNLRNRVFEHINNHYPKSFTSQYKCYKLVYYNFFWSIEEAIAEEKRIKGGSRLAKLKLINEFNPIWNDLYETLD